MDVGFRSIGAALTILLLATACSPKTSSSVFNESNYGSAACAGQALTTRYIVQWETGEFTVETAPDVETFKKDFLEPNLEKIRKVDYDRVVNFNRENDVATPMLRASASPTWGQQMIQVQDVWNQGTYGQNVLVGVVDSFVDVTHPQLAGRIAYNTGDIPGNGKDDDNNGYVDDYAGYTFIANPTNTGKVSEHGTHVSGIIAAEHSKGTVRGIAPLAKIIPAPFIDPESGGSIGDAILALQYVTSRGARIVNASWGGAPCLDTLRNAFVALKNKGILVVVAAGNEGVDLDYSPNYPAAFNMTNQITVAAGGVSDVMLGWSNKGFSLVHLAAPGESIFSTITQNRTAYMDGTSMASPFVAGTAALLWSDRPQAKAEDIKTAILRSVDVNPNYQYKVQTLGRLNAKKALEELRKIVP